MQVVGSLPEDLYPDPADMILGLEKCQNLMVQLVLHQAGPVIAPLAPVVHGHSIKTTSTGDARQSHECGPWQRLCVCVETLSIDPLMRIHDDRCIHIDVQCIQVIHISPIVLQMTSFGIRGMHMFHGTSNVTCTLVTCRVFSHGRRGAR